MVGKRKAEDVIYKRAYGRRRLGATRAVATRYYARPAAPLYTGRVARGYTRRTGFYGRFPPSGNELKFFDTTVGSLFDATGEVLSGGQLCLIPQGVTESTRVGRKCVIKSIQARGVISFLPAAGTTGTDTVSLFLVLDKQANGAAAAFTDIFVGTNAVRALRNMANSSRFMIIKRWDIPMNSTAGVSGAYSNNKKIFRYYKRCNIPIEYSSTTGAITEIRSNNIFLAGGSDTDLDDVTGIAANFRVRFSDG